MISEQELLVKLKKKFGFSRFRDGQEETIMSVLTGHDTLAVLPTGGGKSLLYQLPAYLLSGSVLIVSPLISLMQDQVDRLHRAGEKRVLVINGQLSGPSRQTAFHQLGQFKFIFISPESLANQDVIQALKKIHISLFVIDEAHCISQWGPDFRPEYLLLKNIKVDLQVDTTLLLTATAPPAIRKDIIHKMGMNSAEVTQVVRSVNRPNLYYAVQRFLSSGDKEQYLIEVVKRLQGAGIIYFASRKLASQFAEELNRQTNKSVAAYHAGMSAIDRYRLQQQFMNNQIQLICATSAFGMGIDKGDIRFIIHFHEPANLESYVQEVGRAGRDGKASLALLLYSPGDEQIQRNLTQLDLPTTELIDAVKNGKQAANSLGENQELLMFYLRQGYDGTKITEMFKKRQLSLKRHLSWMGRYVNNTTQCRREMILDYFGERLKTAQNPCCDITNEKLIESFEQTREEVNLKSKREKSLNWKQQLYKLFNEQPLKEKEDN